MFRKRQLVILFIVGLLSVVGLVLAIAPGTVFELDGNSVPFNSAPPNEDWNTLNGTTGFNGSSGGSVIHTYVASENPPKIFTQGGSKDPSNTTQWVWKKADTVPDKDTIVDAFAAEYIAPGSNHEIFVFGGDRFAQNGDANIGLWFFQQQVGPLQDTNGNPAGFGPGQHQNGDVFAVSAFTNGGVNPTITVYIWDGSCKKPTGSTTISPGTCAEDNLRLKFASAQGSTCASADFGCAAVNADAAHGGTGDGSTQLSWPYGAKFGLGTNVVPAGGFFEGGIDITELFGGVAGSEPCFSSFLLETRSAQTPSAVLKDFVAGGFNTCGTIVITKACECDQLVNNTSQYEYVVSGSVSTVPSGGTSF